MLYFRTGKYYLRRWARAIIRTNDSPRQIAGGVAIGTFVSFNPTLISQMAVAVVISTLCRCSRIPAVLMVYLSNPFTAVPMYGSAYLVGVWIVRPLGFKTLAFGRVIRVFARPEEPGFWGVVREKAGEIAALGWAGLVPMEVGATVVGAVAGVIMYYVALRFVTGHRLLKAQRMALRAQRRLEAVRARLGLERAATEPQTAAAPAPADLAATPPAAHGGAPHG